MIKKENIYIDMFQWEKEKDKDIGDAPVFNYKTGRRLNKKFKDYFNSLYDYLCIKNKNYIKWVDNPEKNKQLIQSYFRDLNIKQYGRMFKK